MQGDDLIWRRILHMQEMHRFPDPPFAQAYEHYCHLRDMFCQYHIASKTACVGICALGNILLVNGTILFTDECIYEIDKRDIIIHTRSQSANVTHSLYSNYTSLDTFNHIIQQLEIFLEGLNFTCKYIFLDDTKCNGEHGCYRELFLLPSGTVTMPDYRHVCWRSKPVDAPGQFWDYLSRIPAIRRPVSIDLYDYNDSFDSFELDAHHYGRIGGSSTRYGRAYQYKSLMSSIMKMMCGRPNPIKSIEETVIPTLDDNIGIEIPSVPSMLSINLAEQYIHRIKEFKRFIRHSRTKENKHGNNHSTYRLAIKNWKR